MDWAEFEVKVEAELQENSLCSRLKAEKDWPDGTEFAYYLFCNNVRIATKWYTREDYVRFNLAESGTYRIKAFLRVDEKQPYIVDSVFISYAKPLPLPKISIFGSCVSRDMLEYQEDKILSLGAYIARQSIVSAVSSPLACKMEDIELPSNFQRRQVYHDLIKDTFELLRESQADYLMIDLIDERFDLGMLDGSYVTLSSEMAVSAYRTTEIQSVTRVYDKTLQEYLIDGKLLRSYMDAFVERLLEIYRPEQIILHKALFIDTYISTRGRKKNFNRFYRGRNRRNNHLLRFMYDYLHTCIPQAHVIDICDNFHADVHHKWGLGPMHYQAEYYKAALAAVKKMMDKTRMQSKENF